MGLNCINVVKLILVLAFLASCSKSDNSIEDVGGSSQPVVVARADIVGTWSFSYSETQCEERYVFSADGSFSQVSLDEILAGIYRLDSFESDQVELTLQPTQDNLGTNCLGSNLDSTTRAFNFIVSFPSVNQMDWARTTDPGLVIVSLGRQI